MIVFNGSVILSIEEYQEMEDLHYKTISTLESINDKLVKSGYGVVDIRADLKSTIHGIKKELGK